MPPLLLTIGIATVTGSLAGAAVAWLLTHTRHDETPSSDDPPDEWVTAEIDRAAATWAMSQGRPEAAPLMADRLHLLHRLGQRRGRADQ